MNFNSDNYYRIQHIYKDNGTIANFEFPEVNSYVEAIKMVQSAIEQYPEDEFNIMVAH